jgi:hypothetical protein
MRLLAKPKLVYPILTLMLLLSSDLLVKTPKVQLFSLNHGPLLFAHFQKKKSHFGLSKIKSFQSGLTCKHNKKNVWYMKKNSKAQQIHYLV